MQAVILAAGISTRLRPLTDDLPKPMLPVAGRPMLEHIVEQLASCRITDIIITTHYRANRITDYFGDGTRFGVRMRYAHEAILMNTAGSLKSIADLLSDDFLVIGGNDLLPTLDVVELIRFHEEHGGIGTIVFKYLDDPALLPLFGQGVLDVDGRLVAFAEKPERRVSNLVHTTYQIYSPRALAYVPAGIPCAIPEYLIRRLLGVGERIYGYQTMSEFVCISTRDQYEHAQKQMASVLARS